VEKYGSTGQATDYNIMAVCALCMLDNQGKNTDTHSEYVIHFAFRVGGYAMTQLVEALRYKPEGRGFDS
jgi:hypothetical protein